MFKDKERKDSLFPKYHARRYTDQFDQRTGSVSNFELGQNL